MTGMSIPSRHLMLLSGHRSFMMSTSQRMTDSIIFILNLALLIIQNYVSMRKYEGETGREYSLIGACFTSMMYSWLLHTLTDIHSFNKYMIIIAAIVIIELLAVYIIRFCVTNHRQVS